MKKRNLPFPYQRTEILWIDASHELEDRSFGDKLEPIENRVLGYIMHETDEYIDIACEISLTEKTRRLSNSILKKNILSRTDFDI